MRTVINRSREILLVILFMTLFCIIANGRAFAYYTIPLPVTVTVNFDEAQKAVELFNEARKKKGLNELTVDSHLADEALQRAAECVVWFSHARPAGELSSYKTHASGENIGWGDANAAAYFKGIQGSTGHWGTAMDPKWNSTAIAFVHYEDGGSYWVQLFDEDAGDGKSYSGERKMTMTVEISNGNVLFDRKSDTVVYGETDKEPIRILNYFHDWGAWVSYIPDPSLFRCTVKDDSVLTIDKNGYVHPKKVGSTEISVHLANDSDPDSHTSVIKITVEPLNIDFESYVTCSFEKKQKYTGLAITPQISIRDKYNNTLKEGTDYTVRYENNVNPGYADIWIEGKGNYKGTRHEWFEIVKASASSDTESGGSTDSGAGHSNSDSGTSEDDFLANLSRVIPTVTLSANAYVYDGKAKKPSLKVVVKGETLAEGRDYSLEYKNNINPGLASVTIYGKNRCSGNYTVYFTISKNPAGDIGNKVTSSPQAVKSENNSSKNTNSSNVSKNATGNMQPEKNQFDVKLSKISYTYNKKARKPKVSVYANGTKLSSKLYKIKYTDNKNVGIATVRVTGKGKYKAYSGTAAFQILPKKVTFSYVKSKKKQTIALKWKKVPQLNGYEIQWSMDRKFRSGVNTKSLKGSQKKGEISGLTSGKVYYVRIRAYRNVGKERLCGAWSKVRKVKVK